MTMTGGWDEMRAVWRMGRRRALLRARQGAKNQNGSMLVETAFVLPVFLLLAFGFFSFSFALMGYLSATNAARIGARYGALHSVSSGSPVTVAQIQAVVQANLFTPGAIGNPAILVYYGDRNQGVGGNYTGDLLGVGVVWGQNIQIPFRGPQTIYITAEAYRIITR